MRTEINGVLEVDHSNGKIYFFDENGRTLLRLQGIPPIPQLDQIATNQIDVRVNSADVNYSPEKIEEVIS